jgi:hypothetical protein
LPRATLAFAATGAPSAHDILRVARTTGLLDASAFGHDDALGFPVTLERLQLGASHEESAAVLSTQDHEFVPGF